MGLRGTVLARLGAVYRVTTEGGTVDAILRGKTKRGGPRVIVGDVVHLEEESGGDLYAIHDVEPRRSLLARRVPDGRGERAIVANVDRVVVVTAATDPEPIPQLIDRLLVIAAANDLPAIIVVNKIDLDPARELVDRYRAVRYPVLETSAKAGIGVPGFVAQVVGAVSVVTGASGVGKSSLLNAVQPGLALRVGEISARVRRGRHTTSSAVMVPLEGGGYLVDTPGFSDVGLYGLEARDLAACFPEMLEPAESCRYGDCAHWHETPSDCGVRRALEDGTIHPERYASYLALLSELRAAPRAWE